MSNSPHTLDFGNGTLLEKAVLRIWIGSRLTPSGKCRLERRIVPLDGGHHLGFVAHRDQRFDLADAQIGQVDEAVAQADHRLLQQLGRQDVEEGRVIGRGIVQIEKDLSAAA